MTKNPPTPAQPSLFSILRPYIRTVLLLIVLTIAGTGLGLVIPKILARGIDTFIARHTLSTRISWEFFLVALGVLLLASAQNAIQAILSERVARDMRRDLAAKISRQSYVYVQHAPPSRLLTNLTSDIDAVKMFVSQAVVNIVSSLFTIIGAGAVLILIDWRLALAVLVIVPIIAVSFFVILSKVRALFRRTQEIIDWLNRVINESIIGSALIRVLNSQQLEYEKFLAANTDARDVGLRIVRIFATLFPIINFTANLATLIILALGGHYVINGTLSLGNFAAFNSYVSILIFPIILIGFMSNVIARATASYQRIAEVLAADELPPTGTVEAALRGDIAVRNVTLTLGDSEILKDVSFHVHPGTRTAIIGPTAAGKTHLLYLLTALMPPTSGAILYDGRDITEYDRRSLHRQVGFVFQDSVIFNLSLRENIAFNKEVSDEALQKAIATAELEGFVESLPDGLETVVSERGASLSGGQKQRVMLARALALNPRILLLDDFTARVDTSTEEKILGNIEKNYPGLTLVSVTQKIAPVEGYDQIILLMEGEVLASGTHGRLLSTSPEYAQIFDSQRSTSTYEVHA
jgi:ATP-binding cassette subfamily B protein